MQSPGLSIVNGIITLDNEVNDQVKLKHSIDKFKNSLKSGI